MSQNHPDMSEGAAEGRSSYFPRYPLHAGGVLCSMSELLQYRRAVQASLGGTMARRPSSRGPIDTYLDTLGLYRLKVPPQEPLFRIVSEQMCFTQTEYPKFKRMTCDRLLLKKEEYAEHVAEPMEEHVLKLEEGRAAAGVAEMMALADITRCDFWVYKDIDAPPTNVTQRGFSRNICVAGGDSSHFDLVIGKQESTDRAMGQSMVYHTLYSSVYNLKNVQHAVDKMLYDKEYARTRKESLCSQDGALAAMITKMADSPEHETSSGSAEAGAGGGLYATSDDEPCDVMEILDRNMVPFPYKTAKALDGTHYRNLPQDVWTELVKERRREQQRPDSNGFLAGIQCLVELSRVLPPPELARLDSEARPEHRHLSEAGSNLYVAHIQEMTANQGPVCCYVMALGKKLTVPYESLRPLCSTPVPCPVSPSPAGARARTPGRRRSRHSTSERSSCGGERHLSHTDSSCSTPQDLGWSAPSYILGEPPAGVVSPVALAPGQMADPPLVQSPLVHLHSPSGAPPYGMHLVGSPIFSPQFLPAAGAGLEQRLHSLSLGGGGGGAAELPPVAPVIMSPSVHGPPPPAGAGFAVCGDPEMAVPAGWHLVPGSSGAPPLLMSPGTPPAPLAVSSPQPPYPSALAASQQQHQQQQQLHHHQQQQPFFAGYAAMPGHYEQQPPRVGRGGAGLFPLEVVSPAPTFALPESPEQAAAFYSPGSAEESGYRSRNASHSSSNSMDGSVGDSNSPHVRNGALRRGRPPVRPCKPPQPPRNLPPRLSKFSGPPPPPPGPAPPLLYAVPPAFFYPPQQEPGSGGERLVVGDAGGYYLAGPPPPMLAQPPQQQGPPAGPGGYLYLPPQYPGYPAPQYGAPSPAQLVQYQAAAAAAAAGQYAAAQAQYPGQPPLGAQYPRGPAQ